MEQGTSNGSYEVLLRILSSGDSAVQTAWWWLEKEGICWQELLTWLAEPTAYVSGGLLTCQTRLECLPIATQRNVLALMLTRSSRLPPTETTHLLVEMTKNVRDGWCEQLLSMIWSDLSSLHPHLYSDIAPGVHQLSELWAEDPATQLLIDQLGRVALHDHIGMTSQKVPLSQPVHTQSNAAMPVQDTDDRAMEDEEIAARILSLVDVDIDMVVDQIADNINPTNGISDLQEDDVNGDKKRPASPGEGAGAKRAKAADDSSSLSPDLESLAIRGREVLADGGGKGLDVELFTRATAEQLVHVHTHLAWGQHEEASVCEAVTSLLGPDSPLAYRPSISLVQAALMPRVTALKQAPSRRLLSTLQGVAVHFPKAITEGLMLPIFCTQSLMGPAQADALARLAKDTWASDGLMALFSEICRGCNQSDVALTDHHVALLQAILARQPVLDSTAMTHFIDLLARNAQGMASSLKFGTLVFTAITKYGQQVAPFKDTLESVLACNTTFFKKTGLAALAKL